MSSTIKPGDGGFGGWTANFDEQFGNNANDHMSTVELSQQASSSTNNNGGFADFADFASFDLAPIASSSPETVEQLVTSIPSDHLSTDNVDIDFGDSVKLDDDFST